MLAADSGSEWSSPAHAAELEPESEPARPAERRVLGGGGKGREREQRSESDGDGDGDECGGELEHERLLERSSSPPASASATSSASSSGAQALGAGGGGGSAASAPPLRIPELEQTRQLQVPAARLFMSTPLILLIIGGSYYSYEYFIRLLCVRVQYF